MDLFIAYEVRSGLPLQESGTLFVALLVIYTLVIVTLTASYFQPAAIHQLLSDAQFKASKALFPVDASEQETLQAEFASIDHKLKSEGWFLEEGFDLAYLAETLDIPARRLSAIINQGAAKNFSAYINDLKIDRAMYLLTSDPHLQVTQVMFESGFTTKSSFNREFAKRTGTSPSQFRKA